MKSALFILGELAIAGLLAGVLFFAVIYQPAWVWLVAPLVMVGGFAGIIFLAKTNAPLNRILVLLCPASYTVWLLGLGISIQSGQSGVFLSAVAYYVIGVVLLWAHQLLNTRLR